jgi:hypothetical protein
VLAGLLVTLPGFLFAYPNGSQADVGRGVFTGIIGLSFLLSCSGCLLTADASGVERRDGTLRLLFLTRVRIIDVLLGKFASTATTCMLALVAFLPVLMILEPSRSPTHCQALPRSWRWLPRQPCALPMSTDQVCRARLER